MSFAGSLLTPTDPVFGNGVQVTESGERMVEGAWAAFGAAASFWERLQSDIMRTSCQQPLDIYGPTVVFLTARVEPEPPLTGATF